MALRYEYSWDVASLPDAGLQLKVTADSTEFEIESLTGEHTHSDISTVDSDFSAFPATLKAALDAGNPGAATFAVTWNGATGYTITPSTGTMTLVFSTTTTAAYGTNMRRILGFSGDQSAAASHSSNVRPYYLVIPASQGRTEYTRDRESEEIADEALGDDDSAVMISKSSTRKVGDWMQAAEIETTPAVFSDAGTPTHADMVDAGTSANDVPWSWEQAFVHARTHYHRVSVFEGADHEVWEMRAEGAAFRPERWSGSDQPIWSIWMRCRLIGRV